MKADDKADGARASYRTAPGVGGWLRHRLPEWPRIWDACLRRTRAWPVPPRWAPRDWREELDAEGIAAACTAIRNFDPTRGSTLGSLVYHQILSDALARYRQEWGFDRRRRPGPGGQDTPSPSREDPSTTDEDRERLRSMLGRLVEDDRTLIECLYWDGSHGSPVSGSTGISQRAVDKRRQRILIELRCRRGRNIEL